MQPSKSFALAWAGVGGLVLAVEMLGLKRNGALTRYVRYALGERYSTRWLIGAGIWAGLTRHFFWDH